MNPGRYSLVCLLAVCAVLAVAVARGNAQPYTFSTIAGQPRHYGSIDGTNAHALFRNPWGITVGANGNLYVTDSMCVRQLSRAGADWVVTTIAGRSAGSGLPIKPDGTNDQACFAGPAGIAADRAGNLYVADTGYHAIRKVSKIGTNWVVKTIAGLASATKSGTADGINAGARFRAPYGLTIDRRGSLYLTDSYSHTIRRIIPWGTNWVVRTIAGLAGVEGSADGANSAARFGCPLGIAADSLGNLYVVDTHNATLRKITPRNGRWVVSTIIGKAGCPGRADGTNSEARLDWPYGVAVDNQDNIFVVGNGLVRKVTRYGTNYVATTVAGSPIPSVTSSDGTGQGVSFYCITSIAADSAGSLYVTENLNYTVRLGSFLPRLELSRKADQLLLSWPLAASNYVLETTKTLPPVWTPLTNGIGVVGGKFMLTNTAVTPSALFRLHK